MILDSLLNLRASESGSGGNSTMGNPAGWLFDSFGLIPSEAGILISERNAVGLSAVWTCVNIRAGLLASLPFNLYARTASGGRKLALNRREHTILHDRTSPEDTSYQFRHKMAVNWLLWGNAYAQIEEDGRGQLRFLWPYHPTNVRVHYGKTRGEYHYVVTGQGQDGGFVQQAVMPENMLHLRGFCYEGVEGISPIQNYRRGLGLAMAMEIFSSAFYKNGAKTSGVLMYPGRLSPEGRDNLNKSFAAKYEGVQNAGRTILLEEGAKYQPLSMPMSDAEFIASRRMSRAEIAGLFRIPSMLVPGSDDKAATFASSEVFNRTLVDYTLRDDCTMWEHEFGTKLFPNGDHFCQFDLNDLLRADSVARAQYWQARWQSGSISANEIRGLEGENLITAPSGNKYYVPVNYVDANAPPKPEAAGIDPAKDPGKEPTDPANPDPSKQDPSKQDPGRSPANPRPKPGKSSGFRVLLANIVREIQGWQAFNPGRAAAKLRGVLIEPLAAELGMDMGRESSREIIVSSSDALALRVRDIPPEKIAEELEHLVYLLEEGCPSEEENP
jgi:HK97 family phage portal protein